MGWRAPAAVVVTMAVTLSGASAGERPIVYGGDADFPPYEYLDKDGRPAGFNIALIQLAALRANVPLQIRLLPWREVLPKLDRGEIDLVSLAYSDDRGRTYAFLWQTWTLQQAVLFPRGRPSYPTRLDQLANDVVAVEDGSLVHELLMDLPEATRPVLKIATSQPEAVRLFLAGQATAVAGNELSLRFAAADLREPPYVAIRVKSLAYHLATRRGHEAAVAPLLQAIQQFSADGTIHRLVEEHLSIRTPIQWRRLLLFAVSVAAILFLGLLAAIVWSRALQARVRNRTLELLKQRNELERQSHLLDLAHDAIIVRDLNGAVTFWNRGAEEIYGWERREALGRNVTELLQTELPEPLELIEEKLAREGRWEGELKHVARGGREVWVHSRWALQRGPEGYREAVLEINSDVTSQHVAREQLREGEARFRAVADALLGGLIVVNEEGIIEIANPSAERITGWSRAELVGRPLSLLLPPDVEDLQQFYARARERGMGKRTQWRLRRKDGAIISFELALFQFWLGGKHFIGGTFREI